MHGLQLGKWLRACNPWYNTLQSKKKDAAFMEMHEALLLTTGGPGPKHHTCMGGMLMER